MRTAFGYEGCPIMFVPKARPKTVESGAETQAIEQKSGGPDGRVPGGAARTLFAQAEEKIALKLVHTGE